MAIITSHTRCHTVRLLMSLTLFLLSLFSQAQQSQKVYIESFTHDPMDQAAKEYPKRDGSGDLRALIKVRPKSDDFKFDFGYMSAIVDTDHEDETWIYVQKNTRKVTISRSGFTTISNADLGTTLQAGQTYIMNLSYVEPSNKLKKEWLKFTVSPHDAKALVKVRPDGASDYEHWGQTDENGSVARNVECGRYTYQIVAEYYMPSEGVVNLNKPDETHAEEIILVPNFGFLQVDATESTEGAKVFVNDKEVGTIPYKSEKMEYGDYTLTITKGELYKPYNTRFTIRQGETTTLKPTLDSDAGDVRLRVEGDAEIYLDKELKGKGNWNGTLKAGRYEVECRLDKHNPSVRTIEVVANEPLDILLDSPSPITGALAISSTPLDAIITIDGKEVGSTPKTVRDLLIGEHQVTISRTNYKTENRVIEIKKDESLELDINLSSIGKINIMTTPSRATLFINDENLGQTPYNSEIASGDYQVKLKAKGYYDYEKTLHFDASQSDYKIKMDKRYFAKNGGYAAIDFQAGKMMGPGIALGAYFANVNAELSYHLGLNKSEQIFWNDLQGSDLPCSYVYKSSRLGFRLGYGFLLGHKLRLTPQVGFCLNSISASESYNTVSSFDASKTYASSVTIGAKAEYALAGFLSVFATPEYTFAANKGNYFTQMENVSSQIKGYATGLNARIGFSFIF